MIKERTYKITCNACGYSEIVSQSRLAYEEAKTCPKCRKGKMWWVPPAEEARRREFWENMDKGGVMTEEREISPLWVIPAAIILGAGVALGLVVALSREPLLEEIELQPGDNTVKWTGSSTYVSDALADIIDYVEIFYVLRADGEWIQVPRDIWDTWTIPRNQICEIVVDRACTVTGFVWA